MLHHTQCNAVLCQVKFANIGRLIHLNTLWAVPEIILTEGWTATVFCPQVGGVLELSVYEGWRAK